MDAQAAARLGDEIAHGFGGLSMFQVAGRSQNQASGYLDRMPGSPMEGNPYFLGAGKHLQGGAPEMVVEPTPTTDKDGVRTLTEVFVSD